MSEQITISTAHSQAQIDALIKKLRETGKEAQLSEKEINDMTRALQETGTKGVQAIGNINNQLGNTSNIANNLGQKFLAAFAVERIIAFGQELVAMGVKYESLRTAIDFSTGSQEQGAYAMQFISETANRLGLNLASSAEGFKQIAGASRGTVLEGQATRDIFEGISLAASKMKLSADNTTGALLAISQMISKGKVSAEELRGQLGERLPGAFGLFARSIGVSTAELDKMLQKGEVIATDTLPKFAAQLKKEFGTGATEAQGLGASIERLSNNWETFLFTVVSKDGGAIAKTINFIATEVRDLNEALAGEQGLVDRNIATQYELLQQELAAISKPEDIQAKIDQLKGQNELLNQTAILQKKIVDDLKKNDLGGFESFAKNVAQTSEDIFGRGAINSEDIFSKGLTEGQLSKFQEYNKLLIDGKSQLGANALAVKDLENKLATLNDTRDKSNKLTEEQIKKLQREREEAEKLLETLRKKAEVELAGGGGSVGGLEVLEQQQQAELQKQIEQTKKAKKVAQLSELEINALRTQIAKEFDEKKFKAMEQKLEEQKKRQIADVLESGVSQKEQNSALLTLENQYLQEKKGLYQQYGKDVSAILQNIQNTDMKFIQESVDSLASAKENKLRVIEEQARSTRQNNFDVGKQAIENAKNPTEKTNAKAATDLLNTQSEIGDNKQKIQAEIDYLEQKKALYLEYKLDITDIDKDISTQKDAFQKQELDSFKATQEEKTRIAAQNAEKRKHLEQSAMDAGLQIFSAGVQIFKNLREGDAQALQQQEEEKLRLAGNNETKKAAIRAEFEAKKKQIKREEAVQDKISAVFEVILATSVGVAKALPNVVLAGIAGALGLAQLAVIASQPIPKFSTGVIGFSGRRGDNNLALIADGESVITERGTQKAPKTLDMINKGLLGDDQLRALKTPQELGLLLGSNGFDVDSLADKMGSKFDSSLKSLPQTKNFITDKGFFSIIRNGNNETLYINKLFGW